MCLSRLLTLPVLLFFCLGGAPGFAQGERGLFGEAPPLPEAAPTYDSTWHQPGEKPTKPVIVRSRRVLLTPSTIVSRSNRQGADSLDLNLFNDVRLSAKRVHVEQRSDTDYTWHGSVKGYEHGYVIMVVGEDIVAGNIVIDGKMYQVRYAGNGQHKIQEVDTAAFQDEACKAAALPATSTSIGCNALVESGSTIDVLVVYTNTAAIAAGGDAAMLQQIQLGIAETNTTYVNSGITQKVRLAHAEKVSFDESQYASLAAMRDKLVNPSDSVIDNVHILRNEYAADLVSLWVEFGDGPIGAQGDCGIVSRIMDNVNACYLEDGFNVVSRLCATGYYTFGHEMGHNMGARHDRFVDLTDLAPFNYNHGFVFPYPAGCGGFRTIMSYKDQCVDCPRIPYWSNPDIYYYGTSIGVPYWLPNPIDNRLTLNNTAQRVSNFRLAYGLTVYAFEGIGRVIPSFGALDWSGYTATTRYKDGRTVTLSVIPGLAPFIGFYGEGCNGTQTCTVTMNSAKNVEARFYWDGG